MNSDGVPGELVEKFLFVCLFVLAIKSLEICLLETISFCHLGVRLDVQNDR